MAPTSAFLPKPAAQLLGRRSCLGRPLVGLGTQSMITSRLGGHLLDEGYFPRSRRSTSPTTRMSIYWSST